MFALVLLILCGLTTSSMAAVPTASISAHVLDISGGKPAEGVQILAYIQQNDQWKSIGSTYETALHRTRSKHTVGDQLYPQLHSENVEKFTQDNGRVDWVSPDFTLVAGTYRLVYMTKPYYNARNVDTFYPYVEVIFEIKDATQHYHVPLTLSPWGYSTYRGS